MIAYLSGKLLVKATNLVVIDVNGVGYEVQIPLSTYYDLGEMGTTVSLQIYTQVREDAIQLFGFRTGLEKEIFLKLLSVSGVGPKLALTLLSGMSAEELTQAILGGNLVQLTGIPGVGRKTAERLILELKDKLKSLSTTEISQGQSVTNNDISLKSDVVSALINLGWQQAMAEKAVNATLKEESKRDFQLILKQSLKKLYR
ncbi:MAG: Holliday junction branch migration protein RuvA [Acidobacteria bacterium]|nr:Holliday junction branch migration protein RuvA [Acidobacteriota bacterium]